jgi:aminoglycoside phosphotransferase family enzyme/predicted kinase
MAADIAEDQSEVVEFLAKPCAYADKPATVERIDTHGAMIFLAGDSAYKLKRAVKLPYLDFSTLEKRRTACERELELNRMTAPEIYRRVIPITRDRHGKLSLDGEGEVADWAVEMMRFDGDCLFDKLSEAGRLHSSHIAKLACTIARFHADAQIKRQAAWPKSLTPVLESVTQAFAHCELAALRMNSASQAMRETLEKEWDLLDARRVAGFVRRCHGDLHLRNIVLLGGEPRLFDALEFDEDLATIDVLYDLAFLLMDLWHRNLKAEANTLLNHYFAHDMTHLESAGFSLLPLFMSLRAGVRAMVGLDGLKVAKREDRGRLLEETESYARLAKDLIAPSRARLVAVGGMSGTGKTTLARAIAPRLGPAPGAIHLRSDVERKRLFGLNPADRLDGRGYSVSVSDLVYRQMRLKAESILRARHSVILDATFLRPENRKSLAELGEKFGVPLEGVWLEADEAQMTARADARKDDASDANADIVRQQLDRYEGPPPDWLLADARQDAGHTAQQVLAFLRIS